MTSDSKDHPRQHASALRNLRASVAKELEAEEREYAMGASGDEYMAEQRAELGAQLEALDAAISAQDAFPAAAVLLAIAPPSRGRGGVFLVGSLEVDEQEGGHVYPSIEVDGKPLTVAIADAVSIFPAKGELERWAERHRIRARVVIELEWEPRE